MALFPAYEDLPINADTEVGISEFDSFQNAIEIDKSQSKHKVSSSSVQNEAGDTIYKKKKKSKSKSKNKNKYEKSKASKIECEYTGNEEYYVDNKPIKAYLSVNSLYKPARPRYRANNVLLGKFEFKSNLKVQRYFHLKSRKISLDEDCTALTEANFDKLCTDMNRILMTSPSDVSSWIVLMELQNKAPYKWSKTTLNEKKLEILDRALLHNLGNDQLYCHYLDIVNTIYPSFEVSKIIDKLISKDITNYSLWRAKVLTAQCSMARCIVPDVLKLYKKWMQKMFQKKQGDDTMLRIFSNCSMFLRQSGLNEHLFALIKLTLSLNILTVENKNLLDPNEKDQHTLIEYEEHILKSGLPINEIWFRIENLRQSFNFLPCPTTFKCTDPQRIVFDEDICHFCYPLTSKENTLYLVLIILRLLKIPFILTSSLTRILKSKFGDLLSNSDSVEDMVFVTFFFKNHFNENAAYFQILYDFIKELTVSPTYLNHKIGHEMYRKTLMDIVFLCADSLAHDDQQKKIIVIILWLKLERTLLICEQFSGNLSTDYCKALRLKVKKYLKLEENRNITNLYTEYALIEYEMGDLSNVERVFGQLLSNHNDIRNSDITYAVVNYGEILIKEKQFVKAMQLFVVYALKMDVNIIGENDVFTDVKKLSALSKLTEVLNNLVNIEKNVEIMELEQYFLPDYLVNLIKIKVFYECLLDKNMDAITSLDKLLKYFCFKNNRHDFIREQIFETYIRILQWPCKNFIISNVRIYEKIVEALNEFPENVYILTSCAILRTQPWFKIRSTLIATKSNLAVILLIALARHRYFEQQNSIDTEYKVDSMTSLFKSRILNILKSIINNQSEKSSLLQRNVLLWRLYLRILVEDQSSFEKIKQYLLMALDECPWNKSLYIDGTVFAPQEIQHLQDLMIEKQLRIYALQEELQILRNDPELVK